MPHKTQEAKLAYQRAYYQQHKVEVLTYQKEYSRRPEVIAKRAGRKAKWYASLSPEERRQRVADWQARNQQVFETLSGRKRPEVCDICGKKGGKKGTHFDHCHKRGHFRGWLCSPCNTTLGNVNDDVDVLRKMITYLERHRVNHSPQLTLPGM